MSILERFRVDGKVAIVTGASSGLGVAFAEALAEAGADVALGARRANSIRNLLVSLGIEAGRVRTISYGKERPVAVCNDISCWSQNRRAQTVLNSGGVVSQR